MKTIEVNNEFYVALTYMEEYSLGRTICSAITKSPNYENLLTDIYRSKSRYGSLVKYSTLTDVLTKLKKSGYDLPDFPDRDIGDSVYKSINITGIDNNSHTLECKERVRGAWYEAWRDTPQLHGMATEFETYSESGISECETYDDIDYKQVAKFNKEVDKVMVEYKDAGHTISRNEAEIYVEAYIKRN